MLDYHIHRLQPEDAEHFTAMLDLFSEAFEDPENYASARPGVSYRRDLLGRDDIFALVALSNDTVVGAAVAYELMKSEQERSEIYLYDIATAQSHRRKGVATALIGGLVKIAQAQNAYSLYVQADYEDGPAVALYTKLGQREDVLHFDLSLN
ncbi:GNAT family N-acetyltransferase [Aliiroseovarius sp. YM-037]|uniref:GNAT family N-acetyltransferase n=1 Tax=Aliiroseovarius sp. YM-037 TaxID=3341728 RepID=UPI003A80A9B0